MAGEITPQEQVTIWEAHTRSEFAENNVEATMTEDTAVTFALSASTCFMVRGRTPRSGRSWRRRA
jgi:hypothetical protein